MPRFKSDEVVLTGEKLQIELGAWAEELEKRMAQMIAERVEAERITATEEFLKLLLQEHFGHKSAESRDKQYKQRWLDREKGGDPRV